ncbi:MAG: hypothetical protein WC736_09680 [Gallionella sp.]|jgi:hypothetical protein
MGNLHLNSGHIQDFEVELVTEESGPVVAVVTIYTDRENTRYRVNSDGRHPDLDRIVTNLKSGLQAAKDTDADFQINEYSERTYLFVTYPDGKTEQYTGARVQI